MPDTNDTPPGVTLTIEQTLLIRQAARRLKQDFEGTFNAETIERYIADSQTKLESRAQFATWLPILIERFTRDRLRALARLEVGNLDKPAVLFLCVHNAGRSQMAAGWLRHLAGDAVDVFSGGTDPGLETNKTAIAVMAEVGIDIASEYPQPWTDEIARAADVIVSMVAAMPAPSSPANATKTGPSSIRPTNPSRSSERCETTSVAASKGSWPASNSPSPESHRPTRRQ